MHYILLSFIWWIPIRWLIFLSGKKIIFPFYHAVSDDLEIPHVCNLYQPRSIKRFEEDVQFLKKNFQFIGVFEIERLVSNDKCYFHISFDDGLNEIKHNALPILDKFSIPVTIFVNTDFIDNLELFYRFKVGLLIFSLKEKLKTSEITRLLNLKKKDENYLDEIANENGISFSNYLVENSPYLSKIDIVKLLELGHTIGSHSASHPLFSDLDLEQQKYEIQKSFDYIKSNFGVYYRLFSFPFTSANVSLNFLDWLTKEQNVIAFGTSAMHESRVSSLYHRFGVERYNQMKMKYVVRIELGKHIINKLLNRVRLDY